MMKKIVWMMMVLSMILTLVACGSESASAGQEPQEESSQQDMQEQDVEQEENEASESEDVDSEREEATAEESEIENLTVGEAFGMKRSVSYGMVTDESVTVVINDIEKTIPMAQVIEVVRNTNKDNIEELEYYLYEAAVCRFEECVASRQISEECLQENVKYLARSYENLFDVYYTLAENSYNGEDGGHNYGYYSGFFNSESQIEWWYYTHINNSGGSNRYTISYGDVQEYLVVKGDTMEYPYNKIVMRTSVVPGDLKLVPVEDVGYTIMVLGDIEDFNKQSWGEKDIIITDFRNGISYWLSSTDNNISELKITNDKTGEEIQPINVGNIADLGYGTEFTVSWYAGTTYHEVKTAATSRVYKHHEDETIVLSGSMNKNGFIEYDLSQVPSGKYVVGGDGAIINIV